MTETNRVYTTDFFTEEEATALDGAKPYGYTEALLQKASEHGIYRQCGIGYHDECSVRDQRGEDAECGCKCHVDERFEYRTLVKWEVEDYKFSVVLHDNLMYLKERPPHWSEEDARVIHLSDADLPVLIEKLTEVWDARKAAN